MYHCKMNVNFTIYVVLRKSSSTLSNSTFGVSINIQIRKHIIRQYCGLTFTQKISTRSKYILLFIIPLNLMYKIEFKLRLYCIFSSTIAIHSLHTNFLISHDTHKTIAYLVNCKLGIHLNAFNNNFNPFLFACQWSDRDSCQINKG